MPELRYEFDWALIFQSPYDQLLLTGILVTVLLTAITSVTSLAVGIIAAVMRQSRSRVVRFPANAYVEVVRNIPGLFWLLFFYFAFPELLPDRIGRYLNTITWYPLLAGIAALTVNNGAYVSDIFLAGLRAIPSGQTDAAATTGLTGLQQYRYVLLPQAFRKILPPLAVRMIHNFKDTALCMAISAPELTWATQQIESLTFRGMEATTVATIFYVGVAIIAAASVRRVELRLRNRGIWQDIRSEALLWNT